MIQAGCKQIYVKVAESLGKVLLEDCQGSGVPDSCGAVSCSPQLEVSDGVKSCDGVMSELGKP